MVSSISDSLNASMGIASFSQGSTALLDKTDTEIFEDVFDNAIEAVDNSEKTSSSKGAASGGSSSDEEEDYDAMDLNRDGTVSASERVAYERMQHSISENKDGQSQSITDLFEMNAGSISKAISAYAAA